MAKFFAVPEDALKEAFRPALEAELPAVSQLRQRIFGDQINIDTDVNYLHWRYFERTGFNSTLWLFVLQGKILGIVGTEPIEIEIKSASGQVDIYSATRNMDAAVDPDINGSGLGAWMALAMQNIHETILVTGGNQNSTSMLNKLFTNLTVRHYFKILLHSRAFLTKKFNPALAAIEAPIFNSYVRLKLHFTAKFSLAGDYHVENLSIESFLDKYPGNFSDGLGSVRVIRSTDYYRWRFARRDQFNYRVVSVYSNNDMHGYLIYTTLRPGERNAEGYLLDWDVRQSKEAKKILSCLMATAARHCSEDGAKSVACLLNGKIPAQAASKVGFIVRNIKGDFFVHSSNEKCAKAISNPDKWVHTYVDTDGDGI